MSRSPSGRPSAPAARAVTRPAAQPVQWSESEWLAAIPPVLDALGLALSPAQVQQLAAYMGLLSHWNATFNLTALRSAPDMLSHHLADCLAVLPSLVAQVRERWAGRAEEGGLRVLDVGSGGGLPGVVLAICSPALRVSCVDTVGKKAAFIRQVAAELRLGQLRGEHARVEQLPGRYDLITSRAFASLEDFVRLTRQQLAPGGVWMAMKGKLPDEELKALPQDVEVFHVEHLAVPGLDAERCLIWMRPRT
ncbi:MAG: 16S rRNA (guanine(527)-N(7))-methyltransferase RsmG [Proteobacteria bacterium]|uniref:16S rRNA (guanine(527)-N(7))-methyltransferase RsmG n=1 Tax=Aquabacterium sp. TaxID=1872578 RepID=UPI0035C78125|nr:16S rRNA (guanine(527)-N(7))-methyltransferase RsmG [Pseudomonadota bacterium]